MRQWVREDLNLRSPPYKEGALCQARPLPLRGYVQTWNVECSQCGETITAESPDDIAQDIDGNPRHDCCPFAEKPDYPLEGTVRAKVKRSEKRSKQLLEEFFPHKKEFIDTDISSLFSEKQPSPLSVTVDIGVRFKEAARGGARRNFTWEFTSLNGEPIASEVTRRVFECEDCGMRIDGRVVYDNAEGYLPLIHRNCTESHPKGTAEFKPIEDSHLDSA
jgi:hypothetical protein